MDRTEGLVGLAVVAAQANKTKHVYVDTIINYAIDMMQKQEELGIYFTDDEGMERSKAFIEIMKGIAPSAEEIGIRTGDIYNITIEIITRLEEVGCYFTD